ncbi:hypothetical protein MPLSOD_140002 [Mesorhizobium sp. SOD10]|nr:hypothetical protein MPLSOD_140002 [Mesorhizobium sp. SOD10]
MAFSRKRPAGSVIAVLLTEPTWSACGSERTYLTAVLPEIRPRTPSDNGPTTTGSLGEAAQNDTGDLAHENANNRFARVLSD